MRETARRVVRDPGVADDVVQDVFLSLWRRPEAFNPARGELRPFLRLMARSRALDHLRRAEAGHRVRERLGSEYAHEADGERLAETPAAVLERKSARAAVRAAVSELPHEQREAIVLRFWGGFSTEQIARHSGAPLGTVKSRVRLGLHRLEHCAAA
jgi:RNA polymerase sigma-70 factor (ECF subfamily)